MISGSLAWAFPASPDPEKTPGSFCDENSTYFSGYRYEQKIAYCRRGVSDSLRVEIYNRYRIPQKNWGKYTIDHFIPLALGGDNKPSNLWPEHVRLKALRQNLEIELYWELRAGIITREEAVDIIIDAKMNPPLDLE